MNITPQSIDTCFANRVNIHYEWEIGETGRFTANRFQNHELKDTRTLYYKETIEQALRWVAIYHIEIWVYGKWLSDRIKETHGISVKWY